ncbi:ARM repeat-containing protein [Cylindrobasidium torrendii FP15055 ss-10]|uniref:ARM repeat-containing protein n=1 Tax=Cylindrobasidium torrendii FP15055 ss-10 TaxID=1314674 RepID=A0A0D7AWI1_9AGAR|nr:ARM repeat-containing protein [Cylindrobasidium torrendii FP15055 ss-10]
MDPNFAQGLYNLLLQTLSPDTETLKNATQTLSKEYYKKAQCIPALGEIIASSPEFPLRQLAAVELRKRIAYDSGKLWLEVSQDLRDSLKTKLPEIIFKEPNASVRSASARVVAAIAEIEVPLGSWPELLPLLHQASTSSVAASREIGIFMLFSVLENICEGFQEHMTDLFALFANTLIDAESLEVRVTTVRALGVIAQYIDADDKKELAMYQNLLPGMIQVIGQVVEAGNDVAARHLFDVLETLLILEVPILSKSIPELVEFLLRCGGSAQFDPELRVLALNALNWTVQYKKSKVQSANLAPVMLERLMPITTEDEPEDVDDDAPSRSALRIIDGLSTNLPPSQVFPALRTLIVQYFQSPNAPQRRGAMLAIGMAVEGCSEFMGNYMDQVWPLVEAGLQDGDAGVRKATCVAVSCFCEWLEEECAAKHAMLVPAIMNLINDETTQRQACTALDALLEILPNVIDQYLNLIMERLAGLLDTAPISVKSVVTGAIGSAAHASRDRFLPYFQGTMDRLKHFLLLTGEGEESELRGIAMDAIGTFAEAVGKENFRPYFVDLMDNAFQGLEMNSARLRECSFLFFGVMARVFTEEFGQFLPRVVPPLISSLKQDESNADFDVQEAAAGFDASSGSSSSNAINVSEGKEIELEDVDIDKLMDVNSAIAVEKEIAADTIGAIFAATRAQFFPYIEQCSLELTELLSHYYEGIRKSALDSLLEIVRTVYDLSDHAEWTPGAQVNYPVPDQLRDLISHVMGHLLDMYQTEDNKSVVSSLCVGFAETMNKVGPALVANHLDRVSEIAVQILEQKAFCQQDPDQEEEEEAPEDQAEYDSVLISSAGDLVSALASVLGADFAPAFGTFLPLIAKFYKKGRSLSDRSSAVGCLAEIIAGMKGSVTPSSERLLDLFYGALSDEEYEVLSNAAFGLGLLIEHSEQDLSAHYIQLLQGLEPLFNVPAGSPAARFNARDNAAGAVARMIVRSTGTIPLDRVIPLWLSALPLKNDYLENRPVFRCVFHLFQTNSQALVPHLDALLAVFAAVLDPSQPDQVGDEIRRELIGLIALLNQQDAGKIQAAGLAPFLPGA